MNRNILYHGTYHGAAVHAATGRPLRGQTALVRYGDVAGGMLAQFDEFWTHPYCHGWHPFPEQDFVLDEPANWSVEP